MENIVRALSSLIQEPKGKVRTLLKRKIREFEGWINSLAAAYLILQEKGIPPQELKKYLSLRGPLEGEIIRKFHQRKKLPFVFVLNWRGINLKCVVWSESLSRKVKEIPEGSIIRVLNFRERLEKDEIHLDSNSKILLIKKKKAYERTFITELRNGKKGYLIGIIREKIKERDSRIGKLYIYLFDDGTGVCKIISKEELPLWKDLKIFGKALFNKRRKKIEFWVDKAEMFDPKAELLLEVGMK